ncbi:MAG TPA: MlaD family protein [Acidimicrobiales bacterium]|jgi:phospholipid/cholesterol/gamma-HCH transport system substrate-binding protein|nr:MlaD family protein [Acidimicrobiales bacterium]
MRRPDLHRLRRLRPLATLVVLLLACVGLTACWPMGGPATVKVYATIGDDPSGGNGGVGDMASGAPVEISDIPIGNVTRISLDKTQTKARLTLSVKKSAKVPADVSVRIRRSTPLGEKFVELVPANGAGSELLHDGQELSGVAVPDVEELVSSGTDLFAALSADQIAVLIDEGAKAFGGRGPQLRQILDDFDTVAKGYVTRTGTITNLVHDVKTLTDSLAPNSAANAQLLTNLAQTTQILSDQSNHFLDLLSSLNNLARQSTSLIRDNFDRIVLQTHTLRVLTDEVAKQQDALGNILKYLPAHNQTLIKGVDGQDFAQTMNDFVICGLPGGGEDPNDPVNSCGPYQGATK